MERLAIYGWSNATPVLVRALTEHARLRPVAVGDERPAALARARASTGLACFQHVHEMARTVDAEAVLIAGGPEAASVAEAAAHRGLRVLLVGGETDADTMARASEAATRHDAGFAVIRPRLRASGYPLLAAELAGDHAVDSLVLDLVDRQPARELLRDAVALWARLLGRAPLDVAASCVGPAAYPSAIAVQLRLHDEGFASITVRSAEASRLRLSASGARFQADLNAAAAGSELTLTRDGRTEQVEVADGDALAAEARRIAEVHDAGASLDALLAPREAAALGAVERALEGTFAQHLAARERPALRVLAGGGHAAASATPRRLTLVGR